MKIYISDSWILIQSQTFGKNIHYSVLFLLIDFVEKSRFPGKKGRPYSILKRNVLWNKKRVKSVQKFHESLNQLVKELGQPIRDDAPYMQKARSK